MSNQTKPQSVDARAAERSRALIRQAREAVIDRFRGAVLSIYVQDGQAAPKHVGSSVLLTVGTARFLVTAAHVADVSGQETLLVASPGGFTPLVGMLCRSNLPPSGKREDDKVDLAVYALSDDVVSRLGSVSWLTPSDFDPNDEAEPGKLYVTLGFPNSKNKRVDAARRLVRGELFSYVGRGRREQDSSVLGFADDTHVCVSFDKRAIADMHGRRTNPVNPRGLSGGALFAVGVEQLLLHGELQSPKLVGIIIERPRNQKIIVATRVSLLQSMIAAGFDGMDQAFEPLRRLRVNVTTSTS